MEEQQNVNEESQFLDGESGSSAERAAKRREWNRINARKSRLRKKFYMQGLEARKSVLSRENAELKAFIDNLGLRDSAAKAAPVAEMPKLTSTSLDEDDDELVESINRSQRHFLITDATLPDNPITYASQGFFDLTGYQPREILGRNCRFLQGPGTDSATVQHIQQAIKAGMDCHAVILNYTKFGEPFWNDLFIAPLRDMSGRVVNYVGVQANASASRAQTLIDKMRKQGQWHGGDTAHDPAHYPMERISPDQLGNVGGHQKRAPGTIVPMPEFEFAAEGPADSLAFDGSDQDSPLALASEGGPGGIPGPMRLAMQI